jgi:hypothetical protein
VSILAAFTTAPRKGHLNSLLHILSYLNHRDRSKLVLDDSYVEVMDEIDNDWSGFYPYAKEDIPDHAPSPRGNSVQMTVFVDADHAGDLITQRSRTGMLLYLNCSPVIWCSKKQNSMETSTFGSEFIALKTAMEMIKGIRYKLRRC